MKFTTHSYTDVLVELITVLAKVTKLVNSTVHSDTNVFAEIIYVILKCTNVVVSATWVSEITKINFRNGIAHLIVKRAYLTNGIHYIIQGNSRYADCKLIFTRV